MPFKLLLCISIKSRLHNKFHWDTETIYYWFAGNTLCSFFRKGYSSSVNHFQEWEEPLHSVSNMSFVIRHVLKTLLEEICGRNLRNNWLLLGMMTQNTHRCWVNIGSQITMLSESFTLAESKFYLYLSQRFHCWKQKIQALCAQRSLQKSTLSVS